MKSQCTFVAVLGALALLSAPARALSQDQAHVVDPSGFVAALSSGSIQGVVRDEQGTPVGGALISALGATTAFTKADRSGRFEVASLTPGPYLVRAHLSGFVASHGEMVEVTASSRATSTLSLRRATAVSGSPPPQVLAAGVGLASQPSETVAVPPSEREAKPTSDSRTSEDDHGEVAWRLRHVRRGVLQEATGVVTDQSFGEEPEVLAPAFGSGGTTATSARLATDFFAAMPLSGQLNLLTTSSFDSPQQLFSSENLPRSIAYLSVGASANSHADWFVRGAFGQADISSWIVAGTYATRGPARHRYDIGLSYAMQRYDGGNPAALRNVTDGSRNAGEVYGFDTFTITPIIAVTFGTRYARYDYLDGKSLISPRVALTLSPGHSFRIQTLVSHRAFAPGAEEFLPPGENGVWLPPQRTFSSLSPNGALGAERTTHIELAVERDLGASSTVSVRTFNQRVDDQLVTMFGVDLPDQPAAKLGHYFVGNYGDVESQGASAGFRTAVAGRIHGSIEYSFIRTRWNPGDDPGYWTLRLPSTQPLRSSGIHDILTAVETDVPETATRVIVLYRISNAFARRNVDDDGLLDSRFDVQVRQSLPFMDFSTAKWEMLLGVRNFFREAAGDQSVYDELLVVRPPKRIVGGLTMRF
jgi:TonB dependent receptor/Carboxypeptidase regulatory-like domain